MKNITLSVFLLSIALFISFCAKPAVAGPFDWMGKGNIEADPNKEYELAETNGPLMILVSTFSGPNARQDANRLVFELRKRYKYRAYMFDQEFVHDLKKEGKQNPFSQRQNFKKKGTFREYAVLVGDFQSAEESTFQKTLKEVKAALPECMKRGPGGLTPVWDSKTTFPAPTFVAEGERGPLAAAFGVMNPMLPNDMYARRGAVDPFIAGINKDSPFSLLKCPGRYTVRVATFTGKVEMNQDKIQSILDGKEQLSKGKLSELELGGIAATRLAAALRAKGYEAYEFHDRFESIVTIGSFDVIGTELPNGRISLRPEILDIMERFKAKPIDPSRIKPGFLPYEPVTIVGIECDTQPEVAEVPKLRR